MITLNYVVKKHETEDQRQIKLEVASKGTELLRERAENLTDMFSNFLKSFSFEDKEQFVDCFQKIWNSVEKYHMNTEK